MDPDIFNSLAGSEPLAPFNTSTIDANGPADLSLSAVDSSGNMTMPSIATGLQGAGSILGAFGDIIGGQEQQQAYEYNAKLALEQGQFDIDKLNMQEGETLSDQRAIYAKAGVTMSGSPLDTAIQTASQFEMDKQITNYNTQSKANMDKYYGQVARQQSEFKAAGDLIGGATSLATTAAMLA